MNPNVLHRWRREFAQGPGNSFSGPGKRRWERNQMAELERKIGQQALEIDFFKEVLATHRGAAAAAGLGWKAAIYRQIREEAEAGGQMTVERMAELAGVSRSSLYRFDPDRVLVDADLNLRDAIQR